MPFGPQNCALLGDVGIERNDVQREVDFVDHALAGAVPARKEFEVFDSVVLPVAVDVMHRLLGEQFPTKVLRHDVAVFHDGFGTAVSREHRYSDPYITVALYVLLVAAGFKAILSADHLSGDFAFLTAIFLFGIYPTRIKFPGSDYSFSTVLAGEFVLFVSCLAPSFCGASHRAVKRLVPKFLSVGRQVTLHHSESTAAIVAGKRNWNPTGRGHRLAESVFAAAIQAAVFPAYLDFARVAVKRLAAIFTRFLNGHSLILSAGTDRIVALPVFEVKYQLSGRL